MLTPSISICTPYFPFISTLCPTISRYFPSFPGTFYMISMIFSMISPRFPHVFPMISQKNHKNKPNFPHVPPGFPHLFPTFSPWHQHGQVSASDEALQKALETESKGDLSRTSAETMGRDGGSTH